MNRDFFYLDDNNQQNGPLGIDQLGTVNIKPDTLVWTEGLDTWTPAREVEELKSLMSKKPPAPPPFTKAAPTPPVTATVTVTPVKAKNFICNGCGASLEIPKNARGTVKCKFCNNECVLDGIIKNAEIAAKENINSGIPLSASSATLHRQLVSLLSSPYIPLDVFDKMEVVREERYCIPAYLFDCTGEASFSYQVAEQRTQTYTVDRGDRVEVRDRVHTDWKNMNDRANISKIVFVSGSKEFARQVEELYMHLDSNLLVDFEELDFPLDVVTYNYNLPQPAAFSEHVKPYVEWLLQQEAKKKAGIFSMGSSKIQKEITRVFLGLYRVVFTYGNKEYSMWATGDGQKVICDELPNDSQREREREQRQEAINSAYAMIPKEKEVKKMLWPIVGLLVSVLFIIDGFGAIVNGSGGALFYLLIGIPAAIILWVKISKIQKAKNHNIQIAKQIAKADQETQKDREDLKIFNDSFPTVVQQFKARKKALRGIYEKVSGDESAF